MGWLEFHGWLARMDRQKQGPEPDPNSWRNAQAEEHWEEWRHHRDEMRGRMH